MQQITINDECCTNTIDFLSSIITYQQSLETSTGRNRLKSIKILQASPVFYTKTRLL